MFHVGQKVVYVGNGDWIDQDGEEPSQAVPNYNGIYVIAEMAIFAKREFLVLEEFPSDTAFSAKYFRPITERKTDISIFTEMLTPTRQTEKV